MEHCSLLEMLQEVEACIVMQEVDCSSIAQKQCVFADYNAQREVHMIKKSPEQARCLNTEQHLITSVEKRDTHAVQVLLMNKVSPNLYNKKQNTLLYHAVKKDFRKIARLLIEYGADVNRPNKNRPHRRALHAAAAKGNSVLMTMLLKNKALINATDYNHYTALHVACEKKHLKAARCLLWHKADINAANDWYGTPLDCACNQGSELIVSLLLKWGADVTTSNSAISNSPRCLAYNNGHKAILQLFNEYGIPPCFEERFNYYGIIMLMHVVPIMYTIFKGTDSSDGLLCWCCK